MYLEEAAHWVAVDEIRRRCRRKERAEILVYRGLADLRRCLERKGLNP
jgi:hypothetical protein